MRQTLHIFFKDVRRLRLELAALLALFTFWSWAHAQAPPAPWNTGLQAIYALAQMLYVALPCAYCFVIALLVAEEAPVGNRQFWVTRPYRWTHLLAAKLLFVVLFVGVPSLVSDCVILTGTGLPLHDASSLVWRMAGVLLIYALPAAAVAALTRNIRQFGLAMLVSVAAVALGPQSLGLVGRSSARWVLECLMLLTLAAGTGAVLVRQYRWRATARSWIVLLATIALLGLETLMPVDWAFRLTASLWPGPAELAQVRIARSMEKKPPFTGFFGRTLTEEAMIPLRVDGVPQGLRLTVEEADSTVRTRSGKTPEFTTRVGSPHGEVWMELSWLRAELPPESRPVVDVRARLYITVLRPDPPVKHEVDRPYKLGGGSVVCSGIPQQRGMLGPICRSAFFIPGLIRFEYRDLTIGRGNRMPSPMLATGLGQDPVATDTQLTTRPEKEARLVLWRPVGYLIRDIEIRNLNLWDYSRDNPALDVERVP